jgi:poly-gamma-glutamate synthesis protein (capsule biosynthesis protein)
MRQRFLILLWLIPGFFICFARDGLTLVTSGENKAEPDFLTLIAAGDNLIHESIIQAAFRDGEYAFEPIYAGIKPFIEPADIAFINQETPLAGEGFGYSRGLVFNTPPIMGKTLAETGFNVVSHANNHALDKGEAGLLATLELWNSIPAMQYLGIHRSPEHREQRQIIINKNNINVGFLAYTYGTNRAPLPREKSYLVSLAENEVMAREIDALRPLCDFLVVSMHWGNEYDHRYTGAQTATARLLADHGADLILGHHPHVIQACEYLPRRDGKKTLCFYSLGNFLAAQDHPQTLLGALAYIKIKKVNSETSIEQTAVIPTVTHFDKAYAGFRIYPLYRYTEDLANTHGRKRPQYELSLAYFTALAEGIFGDKIIGYNPFAP